MAVWIFFSAVTRSKPLSGIPIIISWSLSHGVPRIFEKSSLKDQRGELVRGGIRSGAGPSIFDVRQLTSALETPCVARSARKRPHNMRIHIRELVLKF